MPTESRFFLVPWSVWDVGHAQGAQVCLTGWFLLGDVVIWWSSWWWSCWWSSSPPWSSPSPSSSSPPSSSSSSPSSSSPSSSPSSSSSPPSSSSSWSSWSLSSAASAACAERFSGLKWQLGPLLPGEIETEGRDQSLVAGKQPVRSSCETDLLAVQFWYPLVN